MIRTPRRAFLVTSGAPLLAIALPQLALAQATPTKNRALFQVTDNDPVRWTMILNNIQNMRDGVGGEPVEIELLAYGPGIILLKSDSPLKQRVADLVKSGVKVNACQNTMNVMKLTAPDMLTEIGYVPSGVVEVMRKQQQGWSYIRS
jgi:uncharacterized protein